MWNPQAQTGGFENFKLNFRLSYETASDFQSNDSFGLGFRMASTSVGSIENWPGPGGADGFFVEFGRDSGTTSALVNGQGTTLQNAAAGCTLISPNSAQDVEVSAKAVSSGEVWK